MGLVHARGFPEKDSRAFPVKREDWRGHPNGAIVPRLSPFFIRQLQSDEPIEHGLRMRRESGCITYYEGGVVGKLVFDPEHITLGERMLEAGLGHRVPYFGYFKNGPRITMLSRENTGFDLERALVHMRIKLSEQDIRTLWFEQGVLEGEFARKGVRINIGSNEGRIRNYMVQMTGEGFGILQYIDIDTRCTHVKSSVSEAQRREDVSQHLRWLGSSMSEANYGAFVHGYVAGLLCRAVGASDKAVVEAVKSLRSAWADSSRWLRDYFDNLGVGGL